MVGALDGVRDDLPGALRFDVADGRLDRRPVRRGEESVE